MNSKPILEHIDHDLALALTSRRDLLARAGRLVAGAASVPAVLGALSHSAFGANMPQQIVDVLNFALLLEEHEADYYKRALAAPNLVPAGDRKVFETVGKNESEHVKLLRSVLGGKAMPEPQFDHTAGGKFPDVFSNYQTFTALSQSFEETGVRAYKGQAGNLQSDPKILTTALKIHSVEARHVSEIRRVRGEKGWITGNSRGSLPESAQPTYDGEDNTMQGTADLARLFNVSPASGGNQTMETSANPNAGASQTSNQSGSRATGTMSSVNTNGVTITMAAITEAFDEPLTKQQVLEIVRPFVKNMPANMMG